MILGTQTSLLYLSFCLLCYQALQHSCAWDFGCNGLLIYPWIMVLSSCYHEFNPLYSIHITLILILNISTFWMRICCKRVDTQ